MHPRYMIPRCNNMCLRDMNMCRYNIDRQGTRHMLRATRFLHDNYEAVLHILHSHCKPVYMDHNKPCNCSTAPNNHILVPFFKFKG